jgi:hypothetical protein
VGDRHPRACGLQKRAAIVVRTKTVLFFLAVASGAAPSLERLAMAQSAERFNVAAPDVAAAQNSPPPTRIGLLAGIGFPRAIELEGLADLGGFVALGAEYGVLPSVTVDGVDTNLWSLAVDVRAFPFRGPFFIALQLGRQHVGASTQIAVASLGSAHEVLSLDSWFLNPCVGLLWTSRAGLAFGIDVGLQVPLAPNISSTLPLSLYPAAQRTIDTLGKSVLPTLDLLRVGILL